MGPVPDMSMEVPKLSEDAHKILPETLGLSISRCTLDDAQYSRMVVRRAMPMYRKDACVQV